MSGTPKISPTALVMAKELVDYFEQQGVRIHYAYARALIRECPATVRERYIHAQDAWSWWVLHPDFKPFGEKPPSHPGTAPLVTSEAYSRSVGSSGLRS